MDEGRIILRQVPLLKKFEILRDQLNKLCDHLNLEIGRWNYYSQNEQKIEDVSSKSVSLNASMKAKGA